MAVSKKMKAKGRAIIRSKSIIRPPDFNVMNYQLSMIKALNYYSAEVDDKEKRKFAIQYWIAQEKNVLPLNDLSDAWFSTIGAVAHMATMGIPLSDHDLIRLDSAYKQLCLNAEAATTEKNKEGKPPVPRSKQKTVQDYINDSVSLHVGEIEGAIDDLLIKDTKFDTRLYLSVNQVKAPVAKKIGDWFKLKLKEFRAAIEDKELTEAYGGKRVLNKLVSLVDSIVNDCATVEVIAKTTRAPRIRKEKPASVLAAKMKYLREFLDLKLRSVTPDKIVGADMVILYDTEKRRIIKYESADGYSLSVRGTTLMNFNPEKSGSKICRKPEAQLKNVAALTKRPIGNLFNEIKATMGKVTGRINDKMIIVSVFN